MKQDMNGVRTAQDLEQKYNLGAIDEIKKETQRNTEQITSTNNELKDFTTQVTKDLGELQDQIDGNIMTWFLSGVPTLSNQPANEWLTDEEKNNHLGDLYYDKDTGYAYRFTLENGVYNWLKLTDSDIAEALAVANSAQDTADSKRRVFLEQPIPPYDSGDMWIKDKEIYICQVSKAKGESYEEKDFINNLKYTDDTVANQVGENLTVLSGSVTEIKTSVDGITQQVTDTQTLVNEQGKEIGILSQNYTRLEQSANELNIVVSETRNNLESQQDDISNLNSSIANTNNELNNIKNDVSNTSDLVNDMKYSFTTDSLNIKSSNDPVNSAFDNKGVRVYNYTTLKSVLNDKGSGFDDLIVTNTAQIAYLKFVKATDENGQPVSDIHHLVSNIQDVTDLLGDDISGYRKMV